MIKRTLYLASSAYLRMKDEQLIIEMHDTGETKTACIEDIGIIILDRQQIIITQSVLAKLLTNNTAIIH
jgi:CRISPR-associated protein Cas1